MLEKSKQIHKWIDLIFGYAQKGQDALMNFNVYHPDIEIPT